MQRREITRALQEYLYAKESPRAPAQARALLPQAMSTQFSRTGTLQSGMPCIALRSTPEVQYTTRLITSLRASASRDAFPASAPPPSGARGCKGLLERLRGVVITSLPLDTNLHISRQCHDRPTSDVVGLCCVAASGRCRDRS